LTAGVFLSLLSLLARLFFPTARLLCGRADQDCFLLPPFGLSLGRLAPLFLQGTLSGGEFVLGQAAVRR
jgi:hypothetical protein